MALIYVTILVKVFYGCPLWNRRTCYINRLYIKWGVCKNNLGCPMDDSQQNTKTFNMITRFTLFTLSYSINMLATTIINMLACVVHSTMKIVLLIQVFYQSEDSCTDYNTLFRSMYSSRFIR